MKRFRFSRLLVGFVLVLLSGAHPAIGQQDQEPKTPEDKLFRAVESGNKETVLALLNNGVNPNAPNSFKISPLVEAAGYATNGSDLSLLETLLTHGAKVNATDAGGRTALMQAAEVQPYGFGDEGPIHVIEYLLSRGADINHKDAQGETVLTVAMRPGLNRIVRALLAHGADIYYTGPSANNITPLHFVAFANDTARVKMLLQKGENVNARDDLGRTPLILAAEGGSIDTLQALLDAGADVNAKDAQNNTPLLVALHSEAPNAALLLVQRGADVNVRDAQKDTPLLLALRLSDMPPDVHQARLHEFDFYVRKINSLIAALLEKGAAINVIGFSETPLMEAIRRDSIRRDSLEPYINWVKELLDLKADPNLASENFTPLSLTIDSRRHNLELPTLLLDHGADVNSVGFDYSDNGGKVTVLMGAMQQRDFALAKLLIERGAKVECYDNARKTPLLWAAYYGQMDLVKLLLTHSASLQDKDVMGQNALMLAHKGGHPEIAAFLQQRGAKIPPAMVIPKNALGQTIVRVPLTLHSDAGKTGSVTFALGELKGIPALLMQQGTKLAADPVTFSDLLTSPSLWTEPERNDIHYQIQRGYYAPNAYQFFGLVTSGGQTYLGVLWYSPSASQQNQVASFVFRLRSLGMALELTVVHKAGGDDLMRGSSVPALSCSPQGALLLTDENGVFTYQPATGAWNKLRGHGR